MTYDRPSRDQTRPADRTLPDGPAGLAATIPRGFGPSSIATIPVLPVPAGSLIGLLGYVMTLPVPTRGPDGEPVRLSAEQGLQLKSTLAYLTTRADALVHAGRGHLVGQAEAARARHARESDDPYVPPPRSYVGETVRDAVAYLCPVIAEEASVNRTEPGGGEETGAGGVIVPPPEGLNGSAPAV